MSPSGPRILVIDDDPVRKDDLAGCILGEGWAFHEASTVEEALAAVPELEPEVIVLDPRADGGRAAALLVELRRRNHWIPVVLWSADPAIDDTWALEHGASGLEKKGAGTAGVRERIAELLDDTHTDRPL